MRPVNLREIEFFQVTAPSSTTLFNLKHEFLNSSYSLWGWAFFSDIRLGDEGLPNIQGTSTRPSQAAHGCIEFSELNRDWLAELISKETGLEYSGNEVGFVRAHDWIEVHVDLNRIKPEMANFLRCPSPFPRFNSFEFGLTEKNGFVPLEGFAVEFSGGQN